MAGFLQSPAGDQPNVVQRLDIKNHEQSCPLHRDGRIRVCWAKVKKGEPCTNKAIQPALLDEVPACGVHRRLGRKSATCAFKLPCGVQCGRICVFKIHGFQLCPLHQDTSTACYIMKIPVEIRQRIFKYLLPVKPIPAHTPIGKTPPVWLEILRTNRQIHEEGIQLLYGTGSFVIEICRGGLSMCYAPSKPQIYRPPPPHMIPAGLPNLALQDYQMQLMLLERQNKQRLLQERERSRKPADSSRQPTTTVNGLMSSPPPLAPRHFAMIRSFIIQILVDDEYNHSPEMSSDPATFEKTTFDFCDHLHKLVARLRLQPLTRLKITMRVGEHYVQWEQCLVRARFLLQPFRRLRNVAQPEVLSVMIQPVQPAGGDEMELLHYLPEYLHEWSSDLESAKSYHESPIFQAYWRLEDMLLTLKEHYCQDSRLESMDKYLLGARVAREYDDGEAFAVIWRQVMNLYMEYMNYQKEFQTNIDMTIHKINGLLVGASGTTDDVGC